MSTCAYSFQDLFNTAGVTIKKEEFYSLPQDEINSRVKDLCTKINWEYEDRVGSDGKIYTAFAPTIKK